MRRRSQVATIMIFVVASVLLPTVTNIVASDLPGAWRPYLWLAWPLTAVFATLLAIAELRKPRSADAERGPGGASGPVPSGVLLYESDGERPAFASWSLFAERGVRASIYTLSRDDPNAPILCFRSRQGEGVGANKSLPATRGRIVFTYKLGGTDSPGNFVYFAMLPMAENGIGRQGLIELGGDVQADPRNPRSPFRQRYFVPRQHYGDDQWHTHELRFDFTNLNGAFYTIFAARANEGIDTPGEIDVWVRGVRAWSC